VSRVEKDGKVTFVDPVSASNATLAERALTRSKRGFQAPHGEHTASVADYVIECSRFDLATALLAPEVANIRPFLTWEKPVRTAQVRDLLSCLVITENGERCPHLAALSGRGPMSDLSLLCEPKRTFANASGL
jgi:hypothetical protein